MRKDWTEDDDNEEESAGEDKSLAKRSTARFPPLDRQHYERQITMGGKAKFQKHTAKELADKQNQKNKGGGGAGIQTRLVPKLNFTCDICKVRYCSLCMCTLCYVKIVIMGTTSVLTDHERVCYLLIIDSIYYRAPRRTSSRTKRTT